MHIMDDNENSVLVTLSDNGQLTIPPEYRSALSLRNGAKLSLIRVGDALMLVPHDEAMTEVTNRLEAHLHSAGCGVDDLIDAASSARAEIVRREFGEEDD